MFRFLSTELSDVAQGDFQLILWVGWKGGEEWEGRNKGLPVSKWSIDIHWILPTWVFCLAHDASFWGKMIFVGHVFFHACMQIRAKNGEAGGNFVTYVSLVESQ